MPDAQPTGKLLIANRGEIAVRIHRTARELGIQTVGVHPADDQDSLHAHTVDEAVELTGTGAAAYLDIEQIVAVAQDQGCDAIHPGYGFLAENADFAAACEAAGIVFVGPSQDVLRLFGDKIKARDLAAANGLPVLPASTVIADADQAVAFYEGLQPDRAMILKAVVGGGGRGMRVIERKEDIAEALVRAAAEAQAAFGSGALYAERLIERALHIEVQVVGDRHGNVSHLGERDCSIQRRHQKVVEVAPSPQLAPGLRAKILNAAVALADAAGYDNIGTFEFLVDGADLGGSSPFYFIEANPRLQVEHTVTEAVTGVDLVRIQLALAGGAALDELGLGDGAAPSPRGHAIQLRVNMEKLGEDGIALPRTGTLNAFRPPQGPGVRVDTFGYEGYRTSGLYDSLLAKLIVHSGGPNFVDAVNRARRALAEFVIDGVDTNLSVLMNMMDDPDVQAGSMYTRYVDDHLAQLLRERELAGKPGARPKVALAGAQVDAADPLAVLSQGRRIRERGKLKVNRLGDAAVHDPRTTEGLLMLDLRKQGRQRRLRAGVARHHPRRPREVLRRCDPSGHHLTQCDRRCPAVAVLAQSVERRIALELGARFGGLRDRDRRPPGMRPGTPGLGAEHESSAPKGIVQPLASTRRRTTNRPMSTVNTGGRAMRGRFRWGP